ncbi:Piso0_005662 [Millerozyma farinosa CBS 7064]|uniref:Piso0_005662 protein n=1 Tax=Pichia sorbitophila (strain ATCC MYA-4447 / BCRC 22081 / CBS 7064 / NBRC 10061 / NRRL Y-12695) TaxID=559304 RepID=G8Y2K7_PICSO|nr:Piso0_005662 [Millerozyma farinosa CBS 7064]
MKTIDLSKEVDSHEHIKFAEVAKTVYKARRTVVLTGAGISCNAGIPDFRSSDGLYNMVKTKFPTKVVKGQDLFDISIFRDEMTVSLFLSFMEQLYSFSETASPTETHRFIRMLKDKKKLLRCYTQNIDGLEQKLGLKTGLSVSDVDTGRGFVKRWQALDVVQLHGSLGHLACTSCFCNFDWNSEYRRQLAQGLSPDCHNCYLKYQERLYSGKRLTGNYGFLRPNIVLYGENHPQAEILASGINKDKSSRPDLLIIMGTSLRVDGVKKLVRALASDIHARGGKVLFVNKTPVSHAMWSSVIDYEVLCDCDRFVELLRDEIPDLFLTQEQLDSKRLNQKLITPPRTPESKLKQDPASVAVKAEVAVKPEITVKPEVDDSQVGATPIKQDPHHTPTVAPKPRPRKRANPCKQKATKPTKKIRS